MFNLKIHSGDWVVVCDGAKALIAGERRRCDFTKIKTNKTKEVHEQPDEKTHEQGTDAPGRSVNSVGARRSAMEQTDWHDQAEQRLPRDLSKRLDAAVTTGETKCDRPNRAAACARGLPAGRAHQICATRSAPRSTRTTSRCRCTRSRNISLHERYADGRFGRPG